jgi:hypothetical protein
MMDRLRIAMVMAIVLALGSAAYGQGKTAKLAPATGQGEGADGKLATRLDEVLAKAAGEHSEATKQLAPLSPGRGLRFEASLNPKFDTAPGFDRKNFQAWSLNEHGYGECLNRSAAMEELVLAAGKSAELADLLRLAIKRLDKADASARGVVCEFLAHFPRQTLEADLLPDLAKVLADSRFCFDGASIDMGQESDYINRLGKGMSVADLANLVMWRATTFSFPSRKAFDGWWTRNKDYRQRLWYWSLRWRRAMPEPPALADVADLKPADGLRLLLLAGNGAAVVVDAGLPESNRFNGDGRTDPGSPVQRTCVDVDVSSATIADCVRKHDELKAAVIGTLHGEIPWPEARGKEGFNSLVSTVIYVLPLICDKADVPRLKPLLGRKDEPIRRIQRELSDLVVKLDPAEAEAVIVEQLNKGLAASVPELIRISGLKHRELIHKLGPGGDVLRALASLGTAQAAALAGQWLNERDWTPKVDDRCGYEIDSAPEFLFLDFVQAARAFNGGQPVVSDDLVKQSMWRAHKTATPEEIRAEAQHNKQVPANRAQALAKLKEFFVGKAAALPATQAEPAKRP